MGMVGQRDRLASGSSALSRTHSDVWTLPNTLTALRILLVAPFVLLYEASQLSAAAIAFALAALTDGLDGFLARRLHQESRLGAVLDPIADKLLCLAALLVLVLSGRLPSWLLFASLARDGVVLTIALSALLRHQPTPGDPSILGKLATLTTNLTVILALAQAIWPGALLERILLALSLLSAISLVFAAIGYALRAVRPTAPRPLPSQR
ncbi:MAG: CDP-alcohol phosphatidyltransferase family protein [Myxococcales bacterium]|jgi:cardiolipin synthase|nr:CDP-alcohol phosphatidyltransferase family protein [Myxococcales bacterium]